MESIEKKIELIAAWIYKQGINITQYGTFEISYQEIYKELGDVLKFNYNFLEAYHEEIMYALENIEGVAQCQEIEEQTLFDITFYLDFCGLSNLEDEEE